MRNRVIIEHIQPQLQDGRYYIKRIVGERIDISADIFGDGHDAIRASLFYKELDAKKWVEQFMVAGVNDHWTASFTPQKKGFYEYKIEGWVDHLTNWHNGFVKKYEDGQHMGVELLIGAEWLRKTAANYPKTKAAVLTKMASLLEDKKGYEQAVSTVLSPEFYQLVYEFPLKQFVTTSEKNLRVRVGRGKELFSTWYELFPRSTAQKPGQHGTFKDVERILPRVAEMGFDVLYLPPIHPIGAINRKGKDNSLTAQPSDPGSPWAIGSKDGGHKSVHSELGTLDDYTHLIKKAGEHGIELALDLAFQCAPDHPYIKEHPEWFAWRPDGTIAYAENPPKKYQDIVPINFETEDWENLWKELRSVILYWVEQGVKIFRVDNPHTKPFVFWEWVIREVHIVDPDVIFLAEAFTRPKVMAALARIGFTQGYSYFIWRNTKQEMEAYLNEIAQTEWREFYRPNFWPNTPDILPYELMGAGANAFVLRLLMAGTLSSNYGLYGPSYEFMENRGNSSGKEEYLESEKYEIRNYDWNHRNRLTDSITRLNHIRRQNPAMQDTYNIHFTRTDNDRLMSYIKLTEDKSNIIWCVANFDTAYSQAGYLEVPKRLLGIEGRMVNLKVTDLLTGDIYHWFNEWNYVELNPGKWPIHIFKVEVR
ncbi:MAG: alpha-1,4-glucan--maltose-1-phosphate maltosyltransferase [Saprospirales bacterium]|nr:alpha-1,4-glucan--maltose-1-phosphate maltosyltransferase [Saprospirales bacterium]